MTDTITTPRTDVNTGFDATRAAQLADISVYNLEAEAWNKLSPAERMTAAQRETQARFEQRIADGKMKDLGNGRYEVTEPGSWDNGEVFYTQRQPGANRQLLVLPEHGLDLSTGKAALFSMFPEWHNAGEIRVGGEKDIRKVISLSGLDFEVRQRPVLYQVGRKTIEVPGHFVNYRSDNDQPLGVVGSRYTPIQTWQSFDFLQSVVEADELIVASAGAFGRGERIFVTCLLPDNMVIDAEGINDIMAPYVAVLDSFDGSGKFSAMCTPWRIRCGNTERFGIRDAVSKWGIRHTAGASQKVTEAKRTLGLARKYFAQLAEEETALARTDLTIDGFHQVMADVTAEEYSQTISGRVWSARDREAEDEARTTRTRLGNDRREDTLDELFAAFARELGETAYTGERALTAYTDHHLTRKAAGDTPEEREQVRRANRLAANLGGDSDGLKTRTHKRLMQLVGGGTERR